MTNPLSCLPVGSSTRRTDDPADSAQGALFANGRSLESFDLIRLSAQVFPTLKLASADRFRQNTHIHVSRLVGGGRYGPSSPPTGAKRIASRTQYGGQPMSTGRRGLILSSLFVGLASILCSSERAVGQPFRQHPSDPGTGRHSLWKRDLTPDQVREYLAKFGQEDGKADQFEDLFRRLLQDKNPEAPKEQVDAAVKRFMNDKEFRDRIIDLAQKQKNLQRDQKNGGQPPRLNQADLDKLVKILPEAGANGEPFKLPEEPLPKFDPNKLPPFDPNNPQFDPQRFPKIDPLNPPKFDPETRFPLDPNTGRPFDPRNGQPIDPKKPPQIDPAQNGIDPRIPPVPPVQQQDGPPNDGKHRFDPDNPLGDPNQTPDKIAKSKTVEAASALWEKNIGPIDESPAVKRALIDLVSDGDIMNALTDGNGRNMLEGMDGDEDKFGSLFGNSDSSFEWPKLDFSWGFGRDLDLDFGSGQTRIPDRPAREPSRSSSSGGWGTLDFGGLQVPWLLLFLILGLLVGAIVWWKWGSMIRPRVPVAGLTGPAPWPVDPREINTREDVVKAFEYLSVRICGRGGTQTCPVVRTRPLRAAG